ncbi:MAG: fibronectin type III domain-containing protein [Ruminococcus sp.]|nr:fibronectin type III domain-containing protein [Ruminococcus sp.]
MNKKLVSILAAAVMTTGAPAAALVPAIVAQGEPAVVVAEDETGFTDQYVKIKKSYAASAKAIRIYWEKQEGATGYRVYRLESTGWKGLGNVGPNTLSYYEGNLESGTAYRYLVRAYKKTDSGYDWTQVKGDKFVTTKPENVVFTESDRTDSSITLKWKVTKSSGYEIYKREHGVDKDWTLAGTTDHMNKNSFKVTGLKGGTKYDFVVRAFRTDADGVKNKSDFTFTSDFTAPVNVKFTTQTCGIDRITFNWQKQNAATGYRVYKYVGGKWKVLAEVDASTTSYTDKGLKEGTEYRYTVRAMQKINATTTLMSPSYNNRYLCTMLDKFKYTCKATNHLCTVVMNYADDDKNVDGYDIYAREKGTTEWQQIETTEDGYSAVLEIYGLDQGKTWQIGIRRYKMINKKKIVGAYTFFSVDVPTKEKYVIDDECKKMVEYMNADRKKAAFEALDIDKDLCALAEVRAYEIKADYSHTRPDGSSSYSIAADFGIGNIMGENYEMGPTMKTAKDVYTLWAGNTVTKGKYLDPMGSRIGVGWCPKTNGWVVLIADLLA